MMLLPLITVALRSCEGTQVVSETLARIIPLVQIIPFASKVRECLSLLPTARQHLQEKIRLDDLALTLTASKATQALESESIALTFAFHARKSVYRSGEGIPCCLEK